MGNLDVYIFSGIAIVLFIIFATTFYNVSQLTHSQPQEPRNLRFKSLPSYGTTVAINSLLTLLNNKKTTKKQKKVIREVMRNMPDMESDGVYFSQEVKQELQKRKEEEFCEYSGLPSTKSYE